MDLRFWTGPSFQDFVSAAQKVRQNDFLVLKGGILEKKGPYTTEEEKSLNARTWEAFSRAVKKEFTHKHIEAICDRYGFDLEEMKKHPFERRYIEFFGVGAANPYTYQLKERQGLFGKKLSNLKPSEIHTLFQKATKNAYLGKLEDPTKLHGGVRHIHEQLTYDDRRNDEGRAILFRGISELVSRDQKIPRLHPYYSRLEMGIICLLETDPENPTLEAVIPAPGERDGETDYYRVHKIISGGGLNAIALVPISNSSKLDPILCFRCTKQTFGHHGAIDSNLENFNEHIGKSGYQQCAKKLEELSQDPTFTRGKKFTVLCYSQGGAHASYFMRDHWRKVSHFIGFNSVGVDGKVADKFAGEINALAPHEIPPTVYHHRNVSNLEGTKGDWVNRVGQKHLGHGIKHPNAITGLFEWLIHDLDAPTNNIWDPTQVANWLNIHGVRPMDTLREDEENSRWKNQWKYSYKLHMGSTQIDPILDTYKRDGTLEDLRHNIGYKIFYNVAFNLAKWGDFFLRLFRIEFFRR